MKILCSLFIILLCGVINCSASLNVPKTTYIRFKEKVMQGASPMQIVKIPAKSKRISSNKGEIVLTFDDFVPDSMRVVINAAKTAWESKMPFSHPVYINVWFEPLEPIFCMETDVSYCESEGLKGCPSSLASQITGEDYGSVVSPDALIVLNSETNWNCSFSSEVVGGYNLYTTSLRAFAIAFGFGSSLIEVGNDELDYYNGFPAYFDNQIHRGSSYMSSLSGGTAEIKSFATSGELFVDGISRSYPLYSPQIFEPYKSLIYINDNSSLMSSLFGIGDKILAIDAATVDVLKKIGWNIPESDEGLNITSVDMADNGIGSSYTSHTFSLDKKDVSVSNYRWRYSLKNKSGAYEEVITSNSSTFIINPVTEVQSYYVNPDGDLEGKIECEYTVGSKQYSARPFYVSLELKPTILSIDQIKKIKNREYSFNLSFTVNYAGAESVIVEVEEEYNTTLRTYRFDEPYYAHVHTGAITNQYYSWVTVVVRNSYGEDYMTLEYEPEEMTSLYSRVVAEISEVSSTDVFDAWIELYTLQGALVFRGGLAAPLSPTLSPGLYIKKEIKNDGSVVISKYKI